MRTILVLVTLVLATPPLGLVVIIAALLGVPDRPGGIFDWVPRTWAKLLIRAAGVRIVLHNEERIAGGRPQVYVSNHVSWFDVFAIAASLRHYKFIAKSELERIPLFGASVRAAGFIFIDRHNRKAAFTGYEAAATRMRKGFSVVVCPEGTRGTSYVLRPFKKGPFVLAVAAGVPIVPTLVYGTREVQRKGSMVVHSGVVHVHFLEPVPTDGCTYGDRDQLSRVTWTRMAETLEQCYGIRSIPASPSAEALEPTAV